MDSLEPSIPTTTLSGRLPRPPSSSVVATAAPDRYRAHAANKRLAGPNKNARTVQRGPLWPRRTMNTTTIVAVRIHTPRAISAVRGEAFTVEQYVAGSRRSDARSRAGTRPTSSSDSSAGVDPRGRLGSRRRDLGRRCGDLGLCCCPVCDETIGGWRTSI